MEIEITVHGAKEEEKLPELVKVINEHLERGICKIIISDTF